MDDVRGALNAMNIPKGDKRALSIEADEHIASKYVRRTLIEVEPVQSDGTDRALLWRPGETKTMSWKVRHAGSPKSRDGLALQQVAQGLADGVWDQTDEVMGPEDQNWVLFESHPAFEEIVEDLEPPPRADHSDETTIDMNALIDVCLVLLIFFMLTMTYSQLQKIMNAPDVNKDDNKEKILVIAPEDMEKTMIHVLVVMDKDKKLKAFVQGKEIKLKDPKQVSQEDMVKVLQNNGAGVSKVQMVLQVGDDVPHGSMVAIQDSAKTAKIEKILLAAVEKK